ncbi:MAG: hypothetical protein ACRDGM_04275 [bacterium]
MIKGNPPPNEEKPDVQPTGQGRQNPDKIIRGMRPWYAELKLKGARQQDMRAESSRTRTEQQCVWDQAILAAAELLRRLHHYDETESLMIHGLLTTKLPKDEEL